MERRSLPIGLQDFRTVREGGHIYIDKTEYLYRLINDSKYAFISRPRRFGKSLICSTLKELFKGSRELFEGLYIHDKVDWKQYPVIHVDFNNMDFRNFPLDEVISKKLDAQAKEFGLTLEGNSAQQKFNELIDRLSTPEAKAVIIIDEYDKAITDHLGEEKVHEHELTLRNFYSVLKSQDGKLRFVFITGVSKYGRMSVFSTLNNLDDISMEDQYACMAGISQQELEDALGPHIEWVCQKRGMTRDQLLRQVKKWYNGFSWDGENTLYNPFSLLNFFKKGAFHNFWFTTDTPNFLMKLFRERKFPAHELESLAGGTAVIENANLDNIGLESLLFQTGYLTIKKISHYMDLEEYELGYPNFEVQHSFTKHILSTYMEQPVDRVETTVALKLRHAIADRNLDAFFEIIQSVLASVPYSISISQEAYFHSLMHVLMTVTGLRVNSELQVGGGIVDSVLESLDSIYIFEFKIDSTAEKAIAQIDEKGYANRFAIEGKSLVKIGASFDTKKRCISEWKAVED